MFQIAMSHIHHLSEDERYDTDTSVPNIGDGLVAIQAFWTYLDRLQQDFGIKFELYDPERSGAIDDGIVLAARAEFPNSHGGADIWVELQKPAPNNDVERIMTLLRTRSRYTNMIHPS